eukprot:2961045-Alexandrium_andersonii.AAC.1
MCHGLYSIWAKVYTPATGSPDFHPSWDAVLRRAAPPKWRGAQAPMHPREQGRPQARTELLPACLSGVCSQVASL